MAELTNKVRGSLPKSDFKMPGKRKPPMPAMPNKKACNK